MTAPAGPAGERSSLALWSLRCALAVVIPGLPALGVALGLAALVQIGRSGGRTTGAGFAWAGIGLGTVASSLSWLVFASVVMPGAPGGSRALRSDAQANLRAVERTLFRHFAAHGSYPVGDEPWTPSTSCCRQPEGTCPQSGSEWSQGLWQRLGFRPLTAPAHQLRYRSESGRGFELMARRGPDCPSPSPVYRLRGRIGPSGGPTTDGIRILTGTTAAAWRRPP